MVREVDINKIEEVVYNAFSGISFKYDNFTKNNILNASLKAEGREKSVLDLLIKNEEIAIKDRVPLCQDTGVAIVNMEIGQDVHFINGDLNDAINKAVRRAYKDNYLRFSVVDDPLFNRINTKDNTPAVIHYEIVSGDKVKISCMAKGFGSENASKLIMLNPSDGIEGIKKEVIDRVKEKGANACPPLTIGIGIGGTMDKCAYLAKKALLRKNLHNANKDYAKLETELRKEINKLDIGPAGLHGQNTCLKVAIEYYPTHIAGLPLAININCHAVRKEEIIL